MLRILGTVVDAGVVEVAEGAVEEVDVEGAEVEPAAVEEAVASDAVDEVPDAADVVGPSDALGAVEFVEGERVIFGDPSDDGSDDPHAVSAATPTEHRAAARRRAGTVTRSFAYPARRLPKRAAGAPRLELVCRRRDGGSDARRLPWENRSRRCRMISTVARSTEPGEIVVVRIGDGPVVVPADGPDPAEPRRTLGRGLRVAA